MLRVDDVFHAHATEHFIVFLFKWSTVNWQCVRYKTEFKTSVWLLFVQIILQFSVEYFINLLCS